MSTTAPGTASASMRIGLLGASRIAEEAITIASRETGDVRAAVAARDPERAREFATEHDYDRVHDDYEALLADDSLDVVYVGLPNGLHAEWTVQALAAGRNVLVEKPFASNLAEFDAVAARLAGSAGWAWEAFHYVDHPLFARIIEIVRSGEIGELQAVHARMAMPAPDPADPRWSFDLAGGALMDVGCYAINGLLAFGEAFGLPLTLQSASATAGEADPRIDTSVDAMFALGGLPATMFTSMVHEGWDFSFEVVGSAGSVFAPNYVKPQQDDRVIVRGAGGAGAGGAGAGDSERVEHLGARSSYMYQLDHLRAAIASGERDPAVLARSRRTMELIDAVYEASGLPLRPSRLLG